MRRRQWIGLVGSVAAHAILLVWGMSRASAPAPQAALEPTPIEIVAWTPEPALPVATMQTRAGAQPNVEVPPSPEVAVPESEPEPPRERAPREPEPEREPEPAVAPVEPLAPASASTRAPEPKDEPAAPVVGDGSDVGRASASGAGRGTAGAGDGDGARDFSSYGAEIVRIVMAEIEEDPVPGIGSGDSIKILLRVLPDGRLARTGRGRFDYATVLASSLGPLRTRGIFRRIERASQRFPEHPDGFGRRYYEMDFTVVFRG